MRAYKPALVDRVLAQDLVDRFLAAGARVIYVGPHLDLKGPRKRVVPLIHHDDHLHVRLQLRRAEIPAAASRPGAAVPLRQRSTTHRARDAVREESRCWISTSDWTS